jgi:hypothetical protein
MESIGVLDTQLKNLIHCLNTNSIFWHQRPDTVRLDVDWLLEVRFQLMLERDYART